MYKQPPQFNESKYFRLLTKISPTIIDAELDFYLSILVHRFSARVIFVMIVIMTLSAVFKNLETPIYCPHNLAASENLVSNIGERSILGVCGYGRELSNHTHVIFIRGADVVLSDRVLVKDIVLETVFFCHLHLLRKGVQNMKLNTEARAMEIILTCAA